MKTTNTLLFAGAATLMFALAAPSLASADEVQQSSGGAAVTQPAPAPAPAPASPSPEEIKSARQEMTAAIARMQSTSRYVRDLLRETRRRGTSRQIACVDGSLSRADVAHRLARAQESEALAAYARSDLDTARTARARIRELDETQKLAARDGTACLPQRESSSPQRVASVTVVRMFVSSAIPPERTN